MDAFWKYLISSNKYIDFIVSGVKRDKYCFSLLGMEIFRTITEVLGVGQGGNDLALDYEKDR